MTEGLDVRAILVPYDSGHRGVRMGSGPEHMLERGLREDHRGGSFKLPSPV